MIGHSRTIQPGTFTDATLWDAAQSTGLPLLQAFEGLWCYADREGRFEWKPRELKLVILPYWEGSFEDALAALVANGFVISYEVNSRRYGLVRNFKKHQHINSRETLSRLPPVPRGTGDSRVNDASTTRHRQEKGGILSSGSESDPISDSDPVCDSGSEDLTGSARDDDEPAAQAGKKSPFRTDAECEAFAIWATIVWRKAHPVGEARATPARLSPIRARLREGVTLEQFKTACESVAASPFHFGENDTGKVYIEPATLFRNAEKLEGWLSKKAPMPKSAPPVTDQDRVMAERDAKLLEEIRAGRWGEQAKRRASEPTPIDMRKFREAIAGGKVKRVTENKRPSRPPPAMGALLSQVGRPMP